MNTNGLVRQLDESECWNRLDSEELGRLALAAGGEVDIFPINFYSDGESILIRTVPGTKLLELTIRDAVAFEVDGFDSDSAWSVVVKGHARELQLRSEIDAADALPLTTWIPTPTYRYVRITPSTLTGIEFLRTRDGERVTGDD
ncbi:pyridoxamine 5'-phosphate oxidase family protein [Paramicrobacterium fandaimingii]|uniref:pyridoxamine 5'-phosphate oxidase family protein n=1 Tax=Paramicrobacterium fandaimingii TaxID=2708079 RepID=UPI0014222623|nr:pyridoxamine 5'-phosphate oxidase family protein [Microbacterium fandaimingii]